MAYEARSASAGGSPDRYFTPGRSESATSSDIISYFENPIVFALIGFLVLAIITRAFSSRNAEPSIVPTVSKNAVKTVPTVPYWLPLLGHLPDMAWNADGFVKGLRNRYTQGVFALNFGGNTHNIIYTPGLSTALLNQKQSIAEFEEVGHRMMEKVFGLPKAEMSKFKAAYHELQTCYKYLLSEPSLGELVAQTARRTKDSLKDLVTGNDSTVDQMPWERTSNVRSTMDKKGKDVVEASLLPLIRDYVAHTANPTIFGSDFLSNFPDIFEDIWQLDAGFLLIAAGLPRWVPIPSLTRAHIARKRILDDLSIFHEAMEKEANGEDPGPKWSALEDVSPLVKARVEVYRKHGFSIRARAAFEHSLIWATNANSDTLIFWMINRIYADKALLEMIREEIEPYVQAVQPESEFRLPEPPRLEKFDVEALCANCPLLKSCYVECLRLDSAVWSLRVMKQDHVLHSRENGGQDWLLRKGEYAHAAGDLHNTDPHYFDDPMAWKADRHIKYEGEDKRASADLGSIRPYGSGASMCKGRAFALKECMMFTAAIVSLWDIEPAGGGGWKMPSHVKATGVYTSRDDTRVWLKQRKLSPASL